MARMTRDCLVLLGLACLFSTAASEVSRVSQAVSLAAGPALCRSKLKTLLPQKLTPSGTNALPFQASGFELVIHVSMLFHLDFTG